jgi:hypothetical protein
MHLVQLRVTDASLPYDDLGPGSGNTIRFAGRILLRQYDNVRAFHFLP